MSFDTTQNAYTAFRDVVCERSDSVVAWIGAGLSAAAGLPTWTQLKSTLYDQLIQKSNSCLEPDDQIRLRKAANDAKREENLWSSFSILKDRLGNESYRSAIRNALKDASRAEIPAAYRQIWQIGFAGVLNLNIDRLASRAFASVHSEKHMHEFTANKAGEYIHVLKGSHPFIANLHGVVEEKSSWVFTTSELKYLFKQPGYQQLISSCLTSRTILFVGISADDIAAGGHLTQLAKSGIDTGSHYWLTDRTDLKTDEWAENAGIRVIRYRNVAGDHAELNEFLTDLKSFQPEDAYVAPVIPSISVLSDNKSIPHNLEMMSSDEIRRHLNSRAAEILQSSQPNTIEQYESFCMEHSEAIYRAWFTTATPPKNVLLGYTLNQEIAQGAFGKVFRATDPDGNTCAIKILLEQVRTDRERLHSFRRGVSSMNILTKRGVHGVVPYKAACEIPAFAVMDFIEGMNIREATDQHVVNDWFKVLNVAEQLVKIIRTSHRLPERVLHRDIRPANIMLKNCWGPSSDWSEIEVVVLDFDLSWHLDAQEISIAQPQATNGYLAPEQLSRNSHVSTRNASVDSFGLGMTLYFLRTGVDPAPSQHLHADWERTLDGAAHNYPCSTWKSLPKRFFRMIGHATRDAQQDRWDMANIQGEIERLREVLCPNGMIKSSELLTEELAARAFGETYEWDSGILKATHRLPGIAIEIGGDEIEKCVVVSFSWIGRDLRKWQERFQTQSHSVLSRVGFSMSVDGSSSSTYISARITTNDLVRNLDGCATAIEAIKSAI